MSPSKSLDERRQAAILSSRLDRGSFGKNPNDAVPVSFRTLNVTLLLELVQPVPSCDVLRVTENVLPAAADQSLTAVAITDCTVVFWLLVKELSKQYVIVKSWRGV